MDAWIDHDLDRRRFGHNHAVGEEKNANYKAALRRFIDHWIEHELSARARHDLASVIKDEGDLIQAREIALHGHNQFPDSPGGKLCYNLVQEIERPNASLTAERVWNDPRQEIEINYKNLTKAYFRLVPWDWEKLLKDYPSRHPEQHVGQHDLTNSILQAAPAHEWSAGLPVTEDYHMRTEKLLAPDDLAPGFYWLVAAHDPEFSGQGGVVSIAPVWVGDLAIVWRTESGSSEFQGLVLDARSGKPLEGVRVRTWGLAQPWRNLELEEYDTVHTDDAGMFRIKKHGGSGRNHVVLAGDPGRQLATANQYSISPIGGDARFDRTVFFTDRDMEYVHLKDYRGSGTEPVNVLSRYRYQDGLRYYESTRDAASHFFIDYLPKGAYVFEYSVRVQHCGAYQTGIAQVQCMYAPEFNSHSESLELEVQ